LILGIYVYFYTYLNIIQNTMGALELVKNICIWIPTGWFIIIFCLFSDVYNFIFNILAKHNGC
jgi:hypothetical protein